MDRREVSTMALHVHMSMYEVDNAVTEPNLMLAMPSEQNC